MLAPTSSSVLRASLTAAFGIVTAALAAGTAVHATDGNSSANNTREFWARLGSSQEVPAVVSNGRGTIRLTVDPAAQTIAYQLEYSGLESDVTQAHIHLAQFNVNGAIVLWLCGRPGTGTAGPAGTPACPLRSGSVSGTLTQANVQAAAAQGILGPADFADVVRAMSNVQTYANVHSTTSPGGEIRGQVLPVPAFLRPGN